MKVAEPDLRGGDFAIGAPLAESRGHGAPVLPPPRSAAYASDDPLNPFPSISFNANFCTRKCSKTLYNSLIWWLILFLKV